MIVANITAKTKKTPPFSVSARIITHAAESHYLPAAPRPFLLQSHA